MFPPRDNNKPGSSSSGAPPPTNWNNVQAGLFNFLASRTQASNPNNARTLQRQNILRKLASEMDITDDTTDESTLNSTRGSSSTTSTSHRFLTPNNLNNNFPSSASLRQQSQEPIITEPDDDDDDEDDEDGDDDPNHVPELGSNNNSSTSSSSASRSKLIKRNQNNSNHKNSNKRKSDLIDNDDDSNVDDDDESDGDDAEEPPPLSNYRNGYSNGDLSQLPRSFSNSRGSFGSLKRPRLSGAGFPSIGLMLNGSHNKLRNSPSSLSSSSSRVPPIPHSVSRLRNNLPHHVRQSFGGGGPQFNTAEFPSGSPYTPNTIRNLDQQQSMLNATRLRRDTMNPSMYRQMTTTTSVTTQANEQSIDIHVKETTINVRSPLKRNPIRGTAGPSPPITNLNFDSFEGRTARNRNSRASHYASSLPSTSNINLSGVSRASTSSNTSRHNHHNYDDDDGPSPIIEEPASPLINGGIIGDHDTESEMDDKSSITSRVFQDRKYLESLVNYEVTLDESEFMSEDDDDDVQIVHDSRRKEEANVEDEVSSGDDMVSGDDVASGDDVPSVDDKDDDHDEEEDEEEEEHEDDAQPQEPEHEEPQEVEEELDDEPEQKIQSKTKESKELSSPVTTTTAKDIQESEPVIEPTLPLPPSPPVKEPVPEHEFRKPESPQSPSTSSTSSRRKSARQPNRTSEPSTSASLTTSPTPPPSILNNNNNTTTNNTSPSSSASLSSSQRDLNSVLQSTMRASTSASLPSFTSPTVSPIRRSRKISLQRTRPNRLVNYSINGDEISSSQQSIGSSQRESQKNNLDNDNDSIINNPSNKESSNNKSARKSVTFSKELHQIIEASPTPSTASSSPPSSLKTQNGHRSTTNSDSDFDEDNNEITEELESRIEPQRLLSDDDDDSMHPKVDDGHDEDEDDREQELECLVDVSSPLSQDNDDDGSFDGSVQSPQSEDFVSAEEGGSDGELPAAPEDDQPSTASKKKQLRTKRSNESIKKRIFKMLDDPPDEIIRPQDNSLARIYRRSKRNRVRTLDHWAGQRPIYKWDKDTKGNNVSTLVGVSTAHMEPTKKRLPKRKSQRVTNRSSKDGSEHTGSRDMDDLKMANILDLSIHDSKMKKKMAKAALLTKDQVEDREFVLSYARIDFKESKSSVGIYTAITKKISNIAFGKLKFAPKAEKSKTKTGAYVTHFNVVYGTLLLKCEGHSDSIVKTGFYFQVDKSNNYSITNLRNDEAMIDFTIIKDAETGESAAGSKK